MPIFPITTTQHIFQPSTTLQNLLTHFYNHPDAKFGLVIYRCVYGYDSDTWWSQLMRIRNAHVTQALHDAGAEDLLFYLDWDVQQDEQILRTEDPRIVREHFRTWLSSTAGTHHNTLRHRLCIMVEPSSLDSHIMSSYEPFQHPISSMRCNVVLISHKSEGYPVEVPEFMNRFGEERDEMSLAIVPASSLALRIYELLDQGGGRRYWLG